MAKHYTDENTALIVLALLKAHNIRKVVASPGTTNMALVASMQSDPYFEMYSAVDERSGAYMACGLAAESGEPVVISCTGATASQNYTPGLTEAFYRKLPILAITSSQRINKVGHLVEQVTDRSVLPNDLVRLSVALPVANSADEEWECETKVNRAILELTRHGGGPVHINLPTTYSKAYETTKLPDARVIRRFTMQDHLPPLPKGKTAIFIGSHLRMPPELTSAIDAFCITHNAVVFCDHTSSYKGKYRLQYALAASQQGGIPQESKPDLFIHIGEISGDAFSAKMCGPQVWRVSPDGELRDTFRKLSYVFEMPEKIFFNHYANTTPTNTPSGYLQHCKEHLTSLRERIPELPLSNVWLAAKMAHRIPANSVVHFGILNSLRTWNFFEFPDSVESTCNVGGFGIDGCVSSLIGASLADPHKLYFCVVGDLASFYDLNVLGNRHVGRNLPSISPPMNSLPQRDILATNRVN